MSKVGEAFKNYIVDSVILIIVGLVMLIWPQQTLATLFWVIGIALIVAGAVHIITYLTKKDKQERKVASLIVGVLEVILGILVIVYAGQLVAFFPAVAAIILAFGAIMMIASAIKNHENTSFTRSLIMGIVALMIAVIIFVHPTVLANVMVQATGVAMIIEGILMLFAMTPGKPKKQD